MNTIEAVGSSGSEKDLTDNEGGHTDHSSASASQPQSTTGSTGSGGSTGASASVVPPSNTTQASQPLQATDQLSTQSLADSTEPINLVLRMR
jgi:hypothetical protein